MHSSSMRTVRCNGCLSCHAHPPKCHACPPHSAMHAPHLPCMPPLSRMPPAMHAPVPHTHPCYTCPAPGMHAPLLAHPLCHVCPATHAPPTDRMTDACQNITFPQLLLRSSKISTFYGRYTVIPLEVEEPVFY